MRELSNHCAEIWALRQLGDEVYRRPSCGGTAPGEPGCGGAAWLQEQLVTSYAPAWFDQLEKPNGADAAIAQAGLAGRWLNYYVEGLRESIEHSPHINGTSMSTPQCAIRRFSTRRFSAIDFWARPCLSRLLTLARCDAHRYLL